MESNEDELGSIDAVVIGVSRERRGLPGENEAHGEQRNGGAPVQAGG
jgi:hypothetical protein